MRYDFIYENNNGEKINLSKFPYWVNVEPLLNYLWTYKTKQRKLGNRIIGFTKDVNDNTATLHIVSSTERGRDEAVDYFNNVIERDIYYGTAGKLWLGDWFTYAFITASKNSKWQYGLGVVKKEITISRESDSWYHITRSANYGEQEESTVYIAEDYIKTYEGRDAESDIKSLTATIVPKQSGSGTPSPDNVRPIEGWTEVETSVCGKNLLDEQNTTIYKRFLRALGSNNAEWAESNDSASVAVACKPNATYTITASNSSATLIRAAWVDYNPDDVQTGQTPIVYDLISHSPYSAITITTGTSAKYLIVQCNAALVEAKTAKLQVELGTTATAYEPYTATTHTTSLGRTVYGGTVDLVSGTLTDKMGIVDMGTLNWINHSSGVFWAIVNGKKKGVSNIVCSQYETSQMAGVGNLQNNQIVGENGGLAVYIKDTRFTTDTAAFKTAMSGVQLCYELATPQTYQLTPQTINTLAGVNNVWADSGDVTITFRDDHGDIQTESGSIVTFEKNNALSGSGYDYAYDYMHDAQSQKIVANAGSIPCDFTITIQGYVDHPIITIGDNVYSVDVEVPYGANLVIDSTQKTVILTLADGTKINAFGARDPDYYLFERIESGKNAITWDGSYLWELLMIEERSEPRWLTD